ncbi:MAG TPA: pitrilysin family protein [Steroidobacteraceae bacterium]|nr:insulinase family protein [Steroidobacteraceae bacterium]HQX47123.1 pitrilysin family protein [Steroidobacteraceae bacterium]HQX77790.1 pitrilysin family protein [Steroidobacteraceae bacterium]HQZ79899.1 pitrilysin family protein [Steroidobacteraceae bacterium]
MRLPVFAARTSLALLVLAPLIALAAGVTVPPYTRSVLPNGTVLLVMPRKDVPLIAFTALLRGGSVADPQSKPGLASITAGLLEKGAGARDAFAFADAVEGAGGSFTAAAGTEAITVSGQFLAKDQELMIGLLADALERPRFDAAEFDSLRKRRIEELKAAKDSDPSGLIRLYGRRFLFGDHPYGSPSSGSERSLAAISRDDVLGFYHANFGADRLTLIFAGDVDAAALTQAVTRAFPDWRRAAAPQRELAPPPRVTGRRVLLIDQPGAAQTYFWLANAGVARQFADRAALDVVNTLYGGRFTSILNTELRIKSGLSYGAGSGFTRGTVPGEFAIRSFTKMDATGRAIDLALGTLEHLHKNGVKDDMLLSARAYVLGQFPLQLETSAHWVAALTELELYGLDRSYIDGYAAAVEAVTPAAATRVIAEAFPPAGDLVIVVIGDAAKIRSVVAKYGPVTRTTIAAPDFRALPRGG